MKVRMVKPGERYRLMARSSNAHTLSRLEVLMQAEGYVRVKFLSFLAHILNFEYNIKEDWYGNELNPDSE